MTASLMRVDVFGWTTGGLRNTSNEKNVQKPLEKQTKPLGEVKEKKGSLFGFILVGFLLICILCHKYDPLDLFSRLETQTGSQQTLY